MESSGVEILIVEDSATQAENLRRILAAEGYAVSVARNGRIGVEQMRKSNPALVISDVQMPEMDGFELCGYIKNDEGMRNIPVILLTQLSDTIDIIKALECGADNFITKPYKGTYLLAKVREMLLTSKTLRPAGNEQGVEIYFSGQKYFITSGKKQILDILISTYESAVKKNTDLIKSQEELLLVNERLVDRTESLSNLLETITDGILIIDSEGIVKYCNNSAKILLNRNEEDLLNVEFGFPVTTNSCVEIDIIRKNKEPGVAEMRVTQTNWVGDPAMLISMHDITEVVRLRERFRNVV